MYKEKICRVCGKTFVPKSARQQDCNRNILKNCTVCGNEFIAVCNKNFVRETCSTKCSNTLASARRQSAHNYPSKECIICGKEFSPRSNTQKVCDDIHYRECKVCGKQFELKLTSNLADLKWTCSSSCAGKLRNINAINKLDQTIHNRRIMKYSNNSCQLMEYEQFLANPADYMRANFPDKDATLVTLSSRFGIAQCTAGQLIDKYDLRDFVNYQIYRSEQEVVDFIRTISDTEIIRNDRKLIAPNELDIYLPEYKLAIECNPTSTHNSTLPVVEGDPIKPSYHKMKTDKCEEMGIRLFHIFGYEWTHKQDIIKSMLANLLGATSNAIYARECEVREVYGCLSNDFLDNNHRQGHANSKYRYGLFFNDELVAIMTFGKYRNTIGSSSFEENSYELIRFCSKLNTHVVGGASKLFKHFVKEINPKIVRSFSDRAHTSGKLYETLGFKEVRRSDEGYMWVNLKTDEAINRVNCQKQNIMNTLEDNSIDLTKTEKQIMEEHGYVQVFDSGTITWEWHN